MYFKFFMAGFGWIWLDSVGFLRIHWPFRGFSPMAVSRPSRGPLPAPAFLPHCPAEVRPRVTRHVSRPSSKNRQQTYLLNRFYQDFNLPNLQPLAHFQQSKNPPIRPIGPPTPRLSCRPTARPRVSNFQMPACHAGASGHREKCQCTAASMDERTGAICFKPCLNSNEKQTRPGLTPFMNKFIIA